MGRPFLGLYVVLVATLVAFGFAAQTLPKLLLADTESRYFERVSRGTFRLAEEAIVGAPESQRPERLARLQAEFGYPLTLEPLATIDLPDEQRGALRAGRVAHHPRDGAVHLFQRLGQTDQVLVAALEQTQTEDEERIIRGTVFLVLDRITGRPPDEWERGAAELQSLFGFPLRLTALGEPSVSDEQRRNLEGCHIVWVRSEPGQDTYYRRIGESDRVLVLGPVGYPAVFRNLQYVILGCLAVVLGIAVLLWVRPLWQGLVRLDLAANAFGAGDLEARVAVPRRSPLRRLAGTFNEMAERIGTLVASHRDLTQAVSHELRTPVARLRFGAEMARTAGDEETRSRHLDALLEDVAEVEHLVSELLAYARFDRGGPVLVTETVEVEPWLRELCRDVGDGGEGRRTDLEVRLDVDPSATASFDPHYMARAVGNMVRNAVRYARLLVVVRFRSEAGTHRFEVDDDGPGIPLADRERVFEPFTRLDTSRDRRSGGHGLGLAIVRSIARWHGGGATATESPLGGAGLSIHWPADRPTNPPNRGDDAAPR